MSAEHILAFLVALVGLANAVLALLYRRVRHVQKESAEIHVLVNHRLTLALEQNESLLRQNAVLTKRLAALKAEEERES